GRSCTGIAATRTTCSTPRRGPCTPGPTCSPTVSTSASRSSSRPRRTPRPDVGVFLDRPAWTAAPRGAHQYLLDERYEDLVKEAGGPSDPGLLRVISDESPTSPPALLRLGYERYSASLVLNDDVPPRAPA